MLTALRAAGLGLLLAAAPLAASAATINGESTIRPDGTVYDIFSAPYAFGALFSEDDTAGTFDFLFRNSTPGVSALALSLGTVLQDSIKFTGGLTIGWLNSGESMFLPGESSTVAESAFPGFFRIGTTIASGETDTLRISFGDPSVRPGASGDTDLARAGFQFTVTSTATPVPLPAAGWLLLASLGGLAALKRRRATSA